jgi:hypothetical protein
MKEPDKPNEAIGLAVISRNSRIGLIQMVGRSTGRPYVIWEGNTIPICTEWGNIEPIRDVVIIPNTSEEVEA